MNKRIKELAEQCRTITDYGMGIYESFDDAKFAKLIVKECVRTIAIQGLVESATDETRFGTNAYILQCGKITGFHDSMNLLINKFGVKDETTT